jgi:hypothetical protein
LCSKRRNNIFAVVFLTLEVLQFLALESEDREVLAKETGIGIDFIMYVLKRLGIFAALRRVMLDYCASKNSKKFASNVFALLQPHSKTEKRDSILKETTNTESSVGIGSSERSTKTRAKTLVLHIAQMNNETRKNQVQDRLLEIEGVVSFLLDQQTQKATIRATINVNDLIKALSSGAPSFKATAQIDNCIGGQKENEPDYLPDATETINSSNSWFSSIVSWGSQSSKPPTKKKAEPSTGLMSTLYSYWS